MRWIVTVDHHGGCIGVGEDAYGIPARGEPEQAAALPMDFRLHLASGEVLFEAVAVTSMPIGGTVSSR
ncbi:hypothetical protein NJB95_09490 [Brucella intermedia]|uniref:hypothetical protein n=1 Tax=Brucella intermedia TaxID=94625 RepID=UPI00209B4676|nr:hypothetical protein [Brucella intermedia]MCO7736848.1 hypothetical protein [Brucella intermedia]